MKILFLAPEPFFQERGTPIAVRLALEVLAKRGDDCIDLLTYREGTSIEIPNVTLKRIRSPRLLEGINPGISIRKILCDFILLFATLTLVWRNRKSQYDLIHAVEESVFIAALIKLLFGIPYIYDMDSSLSLQLTEKWFLLRPLRPFLQFAEHLAVKYSTAVVPVCDALAAIADKHGATETCILRDISLLDVNGFKANAEDLRKSLQIPNENLIVLYIGNLERYQGIDLLIEAFAEAAPAHSNSNLIIIGGRKDHIDMYLEKGRELGITSRLHLIGPRPVSSLNSYLLQANILVSPRTLGNNTPMKIYSYLHSGKAILATALPTHTQVLDEKVSMLAAPQVTPFKDALLRLLNEKELRDTLGKNAFELAEEKYTFNVFSRKLNQLYDKIGKDLKSRMSP